MKKLHLYLAITVLLASARPGSLFPQSRLYEGPDDPAGDPAAEREVHMDGNRFQIYLNTGGYTGHWGFLDGSKWPRNSQQGLDMYDGCRLIVGSKVYLENDTLPVTDGDRLNSGAELDSLFIIESDAESETAPGGTISWSFTPVFGYFNEVSETPAISIDPASWPIGGWPSRGDELKWPGEWNGRFGRGVQYAQLESYFVMNDAQDQEWLQAEKVVRYYPRRSRDAQGNVVRDVKIGDKRPQVTTQKGLPWGGLGTRVEVRGYQWDNPQTRDIVFWEYNIANISEYDLPAVVFGFMMDLGIGHYILASDGEDDVGSFDKETDMSFCWDINGKGNFAYPVGTLGFAFLESPGVAGDGLDNDLDGLIDERRDNMAGDKIGPLDGISDLSHFMEYYGIQSVEDLKDHYEGDEDQDWRDGNDKNGNGVYDSGENPGDDVGVDGVGPGELNYFGPDADGTECNHQPDQLEGLGAEPNFGFTDISESDMLGLQTFHLFQHPQGAAPAPAHDKECYSILSDMILDDYYSQPNNLYQSFGTGPFRLDKGRTERISMATIAAYEDLSVLNKEKRAPILFDRKKVVQLIYESDYRFAKPPEMPTLKAIPGDGSVVLTWDDRADRLTREPLAGGENDFEGYRLFRSTDRFFEDALKLRDGFGNPAGLKPIKQWDLKNDIFGHTDYALVEGEGFYLGANTGILHYYVDTEVQNGRTYYYYLSAYDHGMKDRNIAPAENMYTIAVDENEQITFISPNIQVVTPRPPTLGFTHPGVEILHDPQFIEGPAESLAVSVADPVSLKPGHTYRITFDVDTVQKASSKPPLTAPWGIHYVNTGYRITDAALGTVVFSEDASHSILDHMTKYETAGSSYGQNIRYNLLLTGETITTDIFDGLQVSFVLPFGKNGIATFDSLRSGWFSGGGGIQMTVYPTNMVYYPFTFDLIFDEGAAYQSLLSTRFRVDTNTGIRVQSKQYLLGETFPFHVEDKDHRDPGGAFRTLDLVAVDMNSNMTYDPAVDEVFAGFVDYDSGRDRYSWTYSLFSFNFQGIPEDQMPPSGSVYRLQSVRPFAATDTLLFRVPENPAGDAAAAVEDMGLIEVVPNPYIITNTLEPAVRNNQLNQRRRIMFTNIPARCTIQIFTMSGFLVDKIEVDNARDNGIAYWDLLTREDLEIAAGIYLYHIQSGVTGKQKTGKFAVIK